jgi:hypothetical protein
MDFGSHYVYKYDLSEDESLSDSEEEKMLEHERSVCEPDAITRLFSVYIIFVREKLNNNEQQKTMIFVCY